MHADITDKNRVPAGITGYYQSFRNIDHANAHVSDTYYADYYTTHTGLQIVWFDIIIIARTLRVIFRARGV